MRSSTSEEFNFFDYAMNALDLVQYSDLISAVLKKANLSKVRDAKLPVYGTNL